MSGLTEDAMSQKDYYHVMGLSPDAKPQDIKLAYRRLARKYHPDLNKEPDAEERFKELGEAYEVLNDSSKRRIYDDYRTNPQPSHHQNDEVAQRTGSNADHFSQPDFDFFESLFGHAFHQGATAQHARGADLKGQVLLTLEEAYQGCTKDIVIPGLQVDSLHDKTIRVKIPSGAREGQSIRLADLGLQSSTGGARGHVYLTVQILKHAYFDRVGVNVYLTLPVTPWEVALGAKITVPTLAGSVELKIPAGSQGGQTLRLKQQGWPHGHQGEKGDQLVLLKIVTPVPTTDAARALYQTMADEMPYHPRRFDRGN